MRVVLTNVVVSAALKRDSTPAAAVHLVEQHGLLPKSAATERQLLDVLARPYFAALIDPETLEWLRQLMHVAEPIAITQQITACRDPTDDKFLELAPNGDAGLIVSGNSDLLVLNPFRGVPIVTPADFVRIVGPQ